MAIYKDVDRGTWYCKFYYTDWQGNKKQKLKRGFKLQREAKEWERKFLEQFAKNPDITFETLYNKYIEYLTPRVRESTLESRKSTIETHILPYFKKRVISDIKPSDVLTWQNTILEKKFSGSYTHLINRCLRTVFNYALEYQGLQKNPCIKSIGSPKRQKITFWTPEEYKRFIEYYKNDIRYFTIFELLYYTGIRIGEALALTLQDIDFKNCTISITKTYYRTGEKELINPPKTESSERDITIPPFLAEEIKEYVKHIYNLENDERLFQMSSVAIRLKLSEGAENTGVTQIRVHDLRHSHASMLINLGANPLLVSKRLGHETPEITLRTYSHLFPTVEADIVNKITKL